MSEFAFGDSIFCHPNRNSLWVASGISNRSVSRSACAFGERFGRNGNRKEALFGRRADATGGFKREGFVNPKGNQQALKMTD